MRHTVRHDQREYTFEFEWTQPPLGGLRFDLRGIVTDLRPGPPETEEVELTVEVALERRVISIRHDDREIGRISLDAVSDEGSPELPERDPGAEDQLLREPYAEVPEGAAEEYAEQAEELRQRVRELGERAPELDQLLSDEIDLEGVSVEIIIQALPSDPVLGCILKSGVSTVVGQIVRCWRRNRVELEADLAGGGMQKVLSLGNCVMDDAGRLGFRFMFKMGKCMIFGGLA